MEEWKPLWYVAAIGLGGWLVKVLGVLDVAGIWKKKLSADRDCKAEVAKLEMTVTKLYASIKTLVQFINNPENLEVVKNSLEEQLQDIDLIIEEIKNKNSKANE